MAQTLGAQIAHLLGARGVDTVFGIPGVHNLELYRGIEDAGLTHVLARHEQGVGFMADGFARASGKPGVALVISGPGLLNILTPLGQATSDDTQLLVISSSLDPQNAGGRRQRLHEMKDQVGAGESVAVWSEEARDGPHALTLVDRALREFSDGMGGARHVQVPIPILEGPAVPLPAPPPLAGLRDPDEGLIQQIAAELATAKRPMFILGGGASRMSAAGVTALRRLVARSGAASFMTYAGRGLLPPNHPRSLGSLLAQPQAAALVAQADMVVTLGSRLAESDLWRDHLGNSVPLVRVDHSLHRLAEILDARPVLADAERFVMALEAALPTHLEATDWDVAALARARAEMADGILEDRPNFRPLFDALAQALPQDATIYSDMTEIAYTAKELWDLHHPNSWHHPTGFGTLGFALPAAIGGKIARPDAPVIAIAGDYGLQFTQPEIATAVSLKLPLPILLWDNSGLGEIERSMRQVQLKPLGVSIQNPDFLALARAYGADATEPATLEEVVGALQRAFDADRPTLIRLTPAVLAN